MPDKNWLISWLTGWWVDRVVGLGMHRFRRNTPPLQKLVDLVGWLVGWQVGCLSNWLTGSLAFG